MYPEAGRARRLLAQCPPALCALALGSCGLGLLWREILPAFLTAAPHSAHDASFTSHWAAWDRSATVAVAKALQYTYGAIGIAALALYIAKAVALPRFVWYHDVRDPLRGTPLSAGAMSVALIAHLIADGLRFDVAGTVVYFAGFATHIALHILFLAHRAFQLHPRRRALTSDDGLDAAASCTGAAPPPPQIAHTPLPPLEWAHVTPAWFVVCVGVGNYAAAATPGFAPHWAQHTAMAIALASLLWQMPLVSFRLAFRPRLEDGPLPAVAVLMAPCALCTAAWTASTVHDAAYFFPVLLPLFALTVFYAIALVACYYRRMFHGVRPSPAWGSYTFPSVIVAVASLRTEAAVTQHWAVPAAVRYPLRAWVCLAILNAIIVVNVVIVLGFAVARWDAGLEPPSDDGSCERIDSEPAISSDPEPAGRTSHHTRWYRTPLLPDASA